MPWCAANPSNLRDEVLVSNLVTKWSTMHALLKSTLPMMEIVACCIKLSFPATFLSASVPFPIMQFVGWLNSHLSTYFIQLPPCQIRHIKARFLFSLSLSLSSCGHCVIVEERSRPEACVIFVHSFDLRAQQLLPIRAFAVD